jgi:DNA-binding transcriptional LysR family regulator
VPDWNDYRYFLAVARAGSLSAAARSLGVDQSTVGRRLTALQDSCGARLFDHTPEGYVLTSAGESVHADLVGLEGGFLAVERRLAGSDARPEGVVRLATTETFATFLVERIAALRVQHPRISVELLTSNQPVDLSRREADVALRIGVPPKQPNLITRHLGTAAFALFASPRYLARRGRPQLVDHMQGHDLVGYAGHLATAPLGRWLDAHAHRANVVLRADSIDVVDKAVAEGLGVGVLPCLFARPELEAISAEVIGSSAITSIVHEDQARSARIRAVILYLADVIQRDRLLLTGARRHSNANGRRRHRTR